MASIFFINIMILIFRVFGQHKYPYKYLTVSNHKNNPFANNASIIQLYQARFTILTDSLIRMEYSPIINNPIFENQQTLTVWNRNLSLPKYNKTIDNINKILKIETNKLLLIYNFTNIKNGFTRDNLKILLKASNYNNNKEWRVGDSTFGNLFGTFRTMDTLNGWQNMNCTQNIPWTIDGEPQHCIFGLISKNGWSIIDDSQTPKLSNDNNWIQPQINGICKNNSNIQTLNELLSIPSCFIGDNNPENQPTGNNPNNEQECMIAGCCWNNDIDRFGNLQLLPLNLYWNPNAQDNVASTFMPNQNGYSFVRIIGYIFKNNQSLNINNIYPVKLWYNTNNMDHFTTTTLKEEQTAIKNNYTMIELLGYLLMDSIETQSYHSWNIQTLNLYYDVQRKDHYSDIAYNNYGVNGYVFEGVQGYLLNTNLSCFKRSGNIDWYFFGHGLDYKSALKDMIKIGDRIPIPRKHMLGVSWSKWENVNESIIKEQIINSNKYGFPMDTYIFDMNWHIKPSWTGYTWDTNLYPNPSELLNFVHQDSTYIGANLHDIYGVQSVEKRYQEMAIKNGIDPTTKQTVYFNICNKTFADSLQNIMLQPLSDEGIDFWWTDWQQGLVGIECVTGLNPTIWLNHYRFINYTQIGSKYRGLILSRFGGWGNHRYPVGFAGDISQTWQSLQFMIYMDVTASNVLFVYWAQEMMKKGGDTTQNLELFTRVIQFGALSPIYTNYGNVGSNDNLWEFAEPYFSAIKDVLILRNQLLPYRYKLCRIAFDDGIGLLRPMYYDFKSLNQSYNESTFGQYMFGHNILISPIYTEINNQTGYSTKNVWLPPNNVNTDNDEYWIPFLDVINQNKYDFIKGNGNQQGTWITTKNGIKDIPIYVKQGSIIPMLPKDICNIHGIASKQFDNLTIWFFPYFNYTINKKTIINEEWIYDDDGLSNDYLNGIYSNTSIKWSLFTENMNKCNNLNISTESFIGQEIVINEEIMINQESKYRNYQLILNVFDINNKISFVGIEYNKSQLPICSSLSISSCFNQLKEQIIIELKNISVVNNMSDILYLCFTV